MTVRRGAGGPPQRRHGPKGRTTGPTLATRIEEMRAAGRESAFLALDELHYGQNLAALLQIAAAGGVDGIVLPPARSHPGVTPTVRRLAGAAADLTPLHRQGLMASLAQFRRAGYLIVGAWEGAERDYHELDYTIAPVVFALGGEDKGLTKSVRSRCEELVRLPMRGAVPSLNVAATAAVLVFERLRQLREKAGTA